MPLLEVKNLKKYFPIQGGLFKRTIGQVRAVNDVSFSLNSGTTLGLVGESGCGKSTLGRTLLRLHEATGGEVFFKGEDILKYDRHQMVKLRRNMQIIFQDPYASLNPRMTVREIIREPLDTHNIGSKAERNDKVVDLLNVVGLRPQVIDRYPHEFSGGQRQRVGIARALALNPNFIVADEPVSALDVSVQSQVLNLIRDLQEKFNISFLFISHDLAVVQHISDHVGVMYFGELVELTTAKALYANPRHPYTKSLMAAIPVPDPETRRNKIILSGDIPSHLDRPTGCPFHPRCPMAKPECTTWEPRPIDVGQKGEPHSVSCLLYE